MSERSLPRAIADVKGGLILASVEIGAPPERVFRALCSEEIAQWWGHPDMYQTQEWTAEVRKGGAWRATGVGSEGKPFTVHGTYLEVDPPWRLVQTWNYAWGQGGETTLTYSLEAIEGGTRLTVRHEGFTDAADCRGHGAGWERVLGWLVAYIVRGKGAALRT